MATFLLYLGLCLSFYFILVTASSGSVCMCGYCGCYSCYSYYRVVGAAIKVTSGTAIRTTYGVVVKIASGISRGSCGHYYGYYCKNSYRDSYRA